MVAVCEIDVLFVEDGAHLEWRGWWFRKSAWDERDLIRGETGLKLAEGSGGGGGGNNISYHAISDMSYSDNTSHPEASPGSIGT